MIWLQWMQLLCLFEQCVAEGFCCVPLRSLRSSRTDMSGLLAIKMMAQSNSVVLLHTSCLACCTIPLLLCLCGLHVRGVWQLSAISETSTRVSRHAHCGCCRLLVHEDIGGTRCRWACIMLRLSCTHSNPVDICVCAGIEVLSAAVECMSIYSFELLNCEEQVCRFIWPQGGLHGFASSHSAACHQAFQQVFLHCCLP